MTAAHDSSLLLAGPIYIVVAIVALWRAVVVWRTPLDETDSQHVDRFVLPIAALGAGIGAIVQLGSQLHRHVEWRRIVGPLQWKSLGIFQLVVLCTLIAIAIAVMRKRGMRGVPAAVLLLALGITGAEAFSHPFGVQTDRRLLVACIPYFILAACEWPRKRDA